MCVCVYACACVCLKIESYDIAIAFLKLTYIPGWPQTLSILPATATMCRCYKREPPHTTNTDILGKWMGRYLHDTIKGLPQINSISRDR